MRGLTPATLAQVPELETSLRYSVTLPLNKYSRKQEVYGMGPYKVTGGLGPTVTTGYEPHSQSTPMHSAAPGTRTRLWHRA